MTIKNIIFDIGNVMVQWRPAYIVGQIFPDAADKDQLTKDIFASAIWIDLNKGLFSEAEAVEKFHAALHLPKEKLTEMMALVKTSQIPVPGSFDLQKQLHEQGYHLFALTDNVHEIVSYLKDTYDFWDRFTDAAVSAELGFLKPSADIYNHLVNKHNLVPAETIFIDDVAGNADGAKAVGMHGIQFKDTADLIAVLENQFQISLNKAAA